MNKPNTIEAFFGAEESKQTQNKIQKPKPSG
jgi:hypothetical protein